MTELTPLHTNVCVCVCVIVMSDLHEHAEAGLEQVCEASGHVLDVGTFKSVWMEDFLQDLAQERTIGRLQNTNQTTHLNTIVS